MRRFALVSLGLLCGTLTLSPVAAVEGDFPQVKINHLDLSEAPKVRVYFSLLSSSLKPALEDNLREVTLYRKPDKGKEEELFGFADGEVVWPKGLSDEEKKKKEEAPPELLPAVDAKLGASIVLVTPGFQDDDYLGTLGERSKNGAGLFFKKLGKTNQMNVVVYTDDLWTYVYTENRTTQLSKYATELPRCEKWKREQAERHGIPPEEGEEEAVGPKKDQAECGLQGEYGEIAGAIKKKSVGGFWPQLFGIKPAICASVKEGERPAWEERSVAGATNSDGSKSVTNPDGFTAIDVALKMLVEGGKPGQPKILILTGDGRDGYINRWDDCQIKFRRECTDRPEVKDLPQAEQGKALDKCIDNEMTKLRAADQAQFAARLEAWLGLAKAAGVRIYSVVHPTGAKYEHDRLEVLAWRTGGTARVAKDAEEVVSFYEDLIAELNNQFVITFNDDLATPDAELRYMVQAKVGSSKYMAKPYAGLVPSKVEKPMMAEFKELGEGKLGKGGFLAVVIGVGVLFLLIFLKIIMKFVKSGEGAAKKAAKGGAGATKALAKAKEKAKKDALKQAKAKAKAKAKLKG